MRNIIGVVILLAAFVFSCNQNKKQTIVKIDTKTIDTVHNAKNSLDYYGEYKGVTPCADCPGVDVDVTLSEGNKYKIHYSYQGKENTVTHEGTFSWDSTNTKITLDGEKEFNQYFVGENTLILLDSSGNRITGDLASNYILKKLITNLK